MKNFVLLLIVLLSATTINAQEQQKKSRKEIRAEKKAALIEQTKKLVESKNFEFVAQRAMPTGGKTISITSFGAQLKGDTIDSYLPYYGRAYTADYGSSTSPLNFTSPIENYSETKNKKGYQIEFKARRGTDNITYHFQIFEDGSASLNINSTNRQPISFSGRIEEIKEPDE